MITITSLGKPGVSAAGAGRQLCDLGSGTGATYADERSQPCALLEGVYTIWPRSAEHRSGDLCGTGVGLPCGQEDSRGRR